MDHFTSLEDVSDPQGLLLAAEQAKSFPHQDGHIGREKTLGLIFLNPSLRTRLSTDIAAQNLGMRVVVLNVNQDGWQLEFEDGVVMDKGKPEHIRDAARVLGSYVDILGVRTFAGLVDRTADYEERWLNAFRAYSGVPIISLESATRHPLQSLADWLTIHQHQPHPKPKVVLTWAPHPKALPQAVANSFVEWMRYAPVELVVTHPKGYELAPAFIQDTPVIHNQAEAIANADFVYVKNWSAFQDYGKVNYPLTNWLLTQEKLAQTAHARVMHCLPVRRNVVATDAVLDDPHALIVEQAQNRIPAAQAVLKTLLTQGKDLQT